ncbi:hypothetical protein CIW83_20365 [Tissierella sp. P1]|jgi:AcrR family transcriptional regulator|uniref:TetR/AcrR family transcriptional regulator n=2 Tax=Tissierellaceae TaxID=1737406 RepID=UPI000B9F9BDE|nr:TetR/AcrR family transcriptional regulator [Tissierella sp. P1]OZV10431.1 hypothetical protein CIW83_20365 [Tissierella sp. P1]
MMKDVEYSEKEIAIFEGLINLIKEGANPYSIKVSDIAIASNVGKGTIYDYFDSKEEAISRAIIYNIIHEAKNAFERINSKDNFKDKFYEILKILVDNMESNFCTLNMLLSVGGIQEFYEYIRDENYDLSRFIVIINDEINRLLELGFKEGIINTTESKYYQITAVKGSISGFVHYISRKDIYKDTSVEEAMSASYKLLTKSLN